MISMLETLNVLWVSLVIPPMKVCFISAIYLWELSTLNVLCNVLYFSSILSDNGIMEKVCVYNV